MMVSILITFASVREFHPAVLKGVEANGQKLLPPPKVTLNKNNISRVQKAILTSYRESQDSGNPYVVLKCHNGKFYSLMHHGIQNFSQELDGSPEHKK